MNTPLAFALLIGGGMVAGSIAAHAELARYEPVPTTRAVHAYPLIGTLAYNESCVIDWEAEDGSARARCAEDGATYYFDPDGSAYRAADGSIVRDTSTIGWHLVGDER